MKLRTIHITLTADQIDEHLLDGKIAVVIDILRASSVIITALNNGASRVIPIADVDQAREMKSDDRLICGERQAIRIPGFDLGNSPLEYTQDTVNGKEIILTTTNGTKALKKCTNAKEILIGGFINLDSISDYLSKSDHPIELVCAGTNGEFSLDDFLFAGALTDKLLKDDHWKTSDLVHFARYTWSEAKNDLLQVLNECSHYHRLVSCGFKRDVDYCFRNSTHTLIPKYHSGHITPLIDQIIK